MGGSRARESTETNDEDIGQAAITKFGIQLFQGPSLRQTNVKLLRDLSRTRQRGAVAFLVALD